MKAYNKIKKYYDDYGPWYHNERIAGYYSFINDIETSAVHDYGINKKTLEIGCGTGIILSKVSKFAKETWGIDLSSAMLQKARELGLNVKEANAVDIPFKDNEFDVTYSFKVLAHIPEVVKAIDEIVRVTKPAGICILEFYNPFSYKFLSNKLVGAQKKIYTRYDSLISIKSLFEDKLEIVEIRGARIITPTAFFIKIPVLNSVLIYLEKLFSKTIISRLAGYMIVVAKNKKKS